MDLPAAEGADVVASVSGDRVTPEPDTFVTHTGSEQSEALLRKLRRHVAADRVKVARDRHQRFERSLEVGLEEARVL